MSKTGVGARLRRKEDDRFLHGRGQYIGDIRFPRMREVAFVRSPVAHARLTGIRIPDHLRSSVFTAKDLTDVRAIRAVSPLPGFQASEQPPLVTDKIRHVGELIAMCVADTRAEAEDIAAQVVVEYEELPAVVDMLKAQEPGSVLVHDTIKRNVFLEVGFDGPVEAAAKTAPVKVTRELRTARQVMSPIECRGFVALWDSRLSQLILHGATQFPHVVRTGLAQVLQLPEIQIRVVSSDVGGGFGYKAILASEEICLCWLAMRCGHPVRWLEDRREQLTANANCREHHYAISAYTDEQGKFLAFDAKAAVDSGAYSAYPFTSAIEPSQVAAILPGPYDIPVYRCKSAAVVTNKCPQLPYRGVARPNVCYAMELMIDAIARQIGKEPYEVRLANLVRPNRCRSTTSPTSISTAATTRSSCATAVEAIDLPAVRARQKRGEPDGRLIGLGISVFSEQTAHGTTADGKRRALYEQVFARITPDGRLEVRAGIQSIGQGLETTLAQIASECLGIDPADIHVKLGDTEISPYSSGAWGSRGIVWAGGATARACKELATRVAAIGAAMLQTDVKSVAGARRRRVRSARQRLAERHRAGILSGAGRSARRYRSAWARSHRRLCAEPAHRRAHRVRPRHSRRGRSGNRRRRNPRLRRGGRRRRPDQSDDRRRPDSRRHRAGHRRRAVRGNAVRRAGPAAGLDAGRLSPARMPGGAQCPHLPHGNAVALHRVRPEGRRRRRRDRAGRRDRQRRERRLAQARRRDLRNTDHAAAHPRGDCQTKRAA